VALSRQEKVAWLEKVPLFDGCSGEVIEGVADVTAEQRFAAGQAVVQQGQVGNGLFIVVSGGVRIVAGSRELGRLGPGDFVGELSVIDQQPRTATALAEGPTVCLALASWDLMALVGRDRELTVNLLRGLAGRLRRADEQLGY
jgi:CRP/FNR family transcriptional regulator, cyclic AMP receptor protein